jgi:hypothetical protein
MAGPVPDKLRAADLVLPPCHVALAAVTEKLYWLGVRRALFAGGDYVS